MPDQAAPQADWSGMDEYAEVSMGYWRGSDTPHHREASRNGRYASQRILLFCLLLLMGCSACDRFGQEKSQEAGAPVEPVQKMPMPRHVEESPKVAAQPVAGDTVPAAPAAAEAAKPGAPAPGAKQEQQPKRADAKKADPSPAGEGKAQPAARGVKEQKGAVPAGQPDRTGAAVAEKKTPPAAAKPAAMALKQTGREQSAAAAATKKLAPAASSLARRWTVVAGPYLLEETLAADLTKVRRAGLNASIQTTVRKKAAMHRLFLAQFDDRAAAQAELDKLKRHTSDAFILEHAGKHAVYAGSYLLDSRALAEKERLAAAGFGLTLRRSEVAIPSRCLVVGTYRDREAAENVRKRLKGAGLAAGTLVRQ